MGDGLKVRIAEDTRATMRARDKARLGVYRMLGAAIKQVEVDERKELDDEAVISVLEKMIKQRREAHSQFQSAGRHDLADQEAFEMEVIQAYLPEPLNAEEVETLIASAVAETGAAAMKDMARVMATLKSRLKGRADMRNVSEKVRQRLL